MNASQRVENRGYERSKYENKVSELGIIGSMLVG